MPWANEQPESLTVGNPNAGHVTMDDGGLRLYANDGVTLLVNLPTDGSGAVFLGTVKTALAGQRWEISSTTSDRITGYTGDAAEALPSFLQTVLVGGAAAPGRYWGTYLYAPNLGHGQAAINLWSGSVDGTKPTLLQLSAVPVGVYVGTNGAFVGVDVQNGDLRVSGKATAPNLAGVDDAIVVAVTVAAGASSGTATFTWPKGLFTAGPIVGAQIVSSSGNAIRATVLLTSVTSSGGTVRVDTNAVLAGSTTFNVHVRGYTA